MANFDSSDSLSLSYCIFKNFLIKSTISDYKSFSAESTKCILNYSNLSSLFQIPFSLYKSIANILNLFVSVF